MFSKQYALPYGRNYLYKLYIYIYIYTATTVISITISKEEMNITQINHKKFFFNSKSFYIFFSYFKK